MKMMKKMGIVAMCLVLLVLTACGGKKSSDGGKKSDKDHLYIGLITSPGSFNPLNTLDVSGRFVQRYMYDALLEMPEPLTFSPKLADSFETEDNQNYTIKLNKEAKWSDGQPITAADVVFTYNLIANPVVETTRGLAVSSLEGTQASGKLEAGLTEIPNLIAVDDQTVTLKTKVPVDPNYLKEVLGYGIFILPKHVLENEDPAKLANASFAMKPEVTSGPYQFVDYKKDSLVELKSNPDYYLGKAKIENVYFKIMNSANMATEFQSGGLTMNASGGIGDITFQDLETVKKMDNLEVTMSPNLNAYVMPMNIEVFTDPNIRLAIAHAINREQIVEKLLKGNGEVIESIYTSQNPYQNEKLKTIEYDVEKAKEYIKKSDYDMDREINLVVPLGNKVREQSANLIAEDLKAAGFKVKQTTYDFATLMEKGRAGDFDLMLFGFGMPVDPDATSYYSIDGSANFTKYDSSKNEALLLAGKEEVDADKRKVIYDELQELWQKDMPVLPLYSPKDVKVKDKNLEGGITEFWQGSLENVNQWEMK
ncbi:ABC transporter substrate-binding protein [Isobaculum melis]|uniref:Peptide/nickel transport system substrate-binding protein n=1 Tax=Isobaculum melis TaxID=142588 RepID=A0A1H9UGL3_9LACT|nr:ABC transporter substrate-binding protein [Isobaculum melis]SES08324.1 peptide/nickel transport system substrate-binding protein [Isobaculum melis]